MRCSIPFLLFACGLLSAGDHKDDPTKADLKLLQGTWLPQFSSNEGEATEKAQLDRLRVVIEGDRWFYTDTKGKSLTEPKPKLILDAAAKPKTLDVVSAKEKTVIRAIYELDGDTLKICFAAGDADRPKTFKSESGSKSGITVFKRLKE